MKEKKYISLCMHQQVFLKKILSGFDYYLLLCLKYIVNLKDADKNATRDATALVFLLSETAAWATRHTVTKRLRRLVIIALKFYLRISQLSRSVEHPEWFKDLLRMKWQYPIPKKASNSFADHVLQNTWVISRYCFADYG